MGSSTVIALALYNQLSHGSLHCYKVPRDTIHYEREVGCGWETFGEVCSAALLSPEPIFLILVDFGHHCRDGTAPLPSLPAPLASAAPWLWVMPHLSIASPRGCSPAARDSGIAQRQLGESGMAEEERCRGRAVLERLHVVLIAGVDLGCRMWDAGCWMGDAGCRTWEVGCGLGMEQDGGEGVASRPGWAQGNAGV